VLKGKEKLQNIVWKSQKAVKVRRNKSGLGSKPGKTANREGSFWEEYQKRVQKRGGLKGRPSVVVMFCEKRREKNRLKIGSHGAIRGGGEEVS